MRWHVAEASQRARVRRDTAGITADAWLYVVLSRRGQPPAQARAPARASQPARARAPQPHRFRLRRAAQLAALLDDDDAVVVVLSPVDRRAGLASLPAVLDELEAGTTGFVALVARRPPPALDFRFDERVTSFACSASVLRAHVAEVRAPHTLCFRVLHGVMAGTPAVARLVVRQIPFATPARRVAPPPRPRSVAVLLPHRGPPALLASALHALACVTGQPRILVGLDGGGRAAYRALHARHPDVEMFHGEPAPVGPYAIRHALAARTRAPHLLFHDSDDVSCADRIVRLHEAMQDAALVGSHELRVDELRHRVIAIRFPLDVSAALRVRPHHPMLFPSTMIRRDGYRAIGGLSTDRAFAYDTQFVFRASFALRLANVDDFLYIRRLRAGSLTTTPATALGTPIRVALLASWVRDFHRIQAGELTLARSSLRVTARRGPLRLVPLAPPRRAPPARPRARAARSGRSR